MAGPRYVRYIAFAIICLVVIFFISSSSAPTTIGSQSVKDRYDQFKGQWKPKSPTPKGEKPVLSRPEVTQEDFDKAAMPKGSAEKAAKVVADKSKDKSSGKGSGSKSSDGSSSKASSSSKDKSTEKTSSKTSDKSTSKGSSSRLDTSPNRQGTLGSGKAPGPRMNATFVTLARNSDIYEIVKSIRQVEDRFNHRYGYDWVFLNDKPFDDEFKKVTTNLISGETRYGLIPEEHWSFPEWIDQDKAADVRKDMAERKIIYGDSISYRHMCRYESGFFFRHEIMKEYEWYWRVEPSIELYCDIEYDTFEYMAKNGKMYSFVISLYEYIETIPTMWDSVKTFMKEHPEHIAKDNSMDFLSDDNGKTYNKCHFWSNFEIANLDFLRSQAYIDYFDRLDKDGGFFYERWGDAPVHSIAAGILLKKEQIHFFNDIAYYHVPFTHCPTEEKVRHDKKCHCDPGHNFDWNGYSCTSRYYDVNNMKKPEGYEKQTEQGG